MPGLISPSMALIPTGVKFAFTWLNPLSASRSMRCLRRNSAVETLCLR